LLRNLILRILVPVFSQPFPAHFLYKTDIIGSGIHLIYQHHQ
jgi:hypothetical protein